MKKLPLSLAIVLFLGMTANRAYSAGLQQPQTIAHQQASIFSETDVERAWAAATKAQKPLLVMFTSDNCLFCKKMLSETYSHPAIEQLLAGRTETVLAHSADYKPLVKKLGIRGYPSTLLISPNGDVLEFMQGYVDPKAFAERVTPQLIPRTANAPLPKQAAER